MGWIFNYKRTNEQAPVVFAAVGPVNLEGPNRETNMDTHKGHQDKIDQITIHE